MSSPAAFDAFYDKLDSDWTATPVKFENEFMEDVLQAESPAAFVYVEIYGDSYNQDSIGSPGSNTWLEQGVTYLHVMTPSGTGSRPARVHADNLLNLFREQSIDGLRMPEMSIGEGQPGKDLPNYWAMTVTIHWHRYDVTGT